MAAYYVFCFFCKAPTTDAADQLNEADYLMVGFEEDSDDELQSDVAPAW